MSRIGNKPIIIHPGVEVILNNDKITVKNSKHELSLEIPKSIKVERKENELIVSKAVDTRESRRLHGTIRARIANMVNGLHEPFVKELEIQGVGYRANLEGRNLVLQVGFSHNVTMAIPEGVEVNIDKNVNLKISGHDKQVVGEFAANIRKVRKPEPYKGKGIRYLGEHVRRKAGKTAK